MDRLRKLRRTWLASLFLLWVCSASAQAQLADTIWEGNLTIGQQVK